MTVYSICYGSLIVRFDQVSARVKGSASCETLLRLQITSARA